MLIRWRWWLVVHHMVWTLDVALWGQSLRRCSCSHGLCPVSTGCANVLVPLSTESGQGVGSLESEVWVSIFFRSFWACVSVWPFRIWYIYIKQLSTELPEEASGGVRTRGTTLGDPRHIHKAMKTLITIKLALKSLEPDYFHFSSIFQTRRLGFGLTWSFSQLGFLQVYVPFLFMISIFLHVLVMFSGLLSLWLPAAPGDISKPMNVLLHACWATVVSPGHLPPRLLQEHPLWFPLFQPCLPEVCFQSSSLRDPIETGLRSCHFPALRKA